MKSMKALFATDGSDSARRAGDYLRDLATAFERCEVVVLHVLRPPTYWLAPNEIGAVASGELMAQLLETARDEGKTIASRSAASFEAAGCKAQGLIAEGDPASEILAVAEAEKVDMIVMGSRGMSPIQGLLLGSVTDRVLHQGEVPTLVIP